MKAKKTTTKAQKQQIEKAKELKNKKLASNQLIKK